MRRAGPLSSDQLEAPRRRDQARRAMQRTDPAAEHAGRRLERCRQALGRSQHRCGAGRDRAAEQRTSRQVAILLVAHLSVPVAVTRNPPGADVAPTLCTSTCGLEKTVSVAKPPNGTSGATISFPSLALTVASTVAVTPNSDAVPLSVRRPSEDSTGTTDRRIGIARRRSDSVTSAVPTSWLPRLRSAALRTVSRPELNSCADASTDP